jgi:hypothetical protein
MKFFDRAYGSAWPLAADMLFSRLFFSQPAAWI